MVCEMYLLVVGRIYTTLLSNIGILKPKMNKKRRCPTIACITLVWVLMNRFQLNPSGQTSGVEIAEMFLVTKRMR